MIVKEILNEELLTLAEVSQILQKVKEERLAEDEDAELPYEFRRALAHAEAFATLSPEDARALVERLLTLEKMKPEIAMRIADILPMTKDELRALYAKERFTLSTEELDEILTIVAQSALED
ncbi:MAG: RNA polymerase Rpb4 family protein [Methermicoccaceae archaeon]